jgi:hypothetical protein
VRGTDGSNPSPSSAESTANLAVAHGSERRLLNGNRNEPCCTRRDPHIGFGVRCSADYDQIRRTDQIVDVPALPHIERTFTSALRISLVVQTSSGEPPSEPAD